MSDDPKCDNCLHLRSEHDADTGQCGATVGCPCEVFEAERDAEGS